MDCNINILPNEILLEIFKYCDIKSLLAINSSCRRFRDIYLNFEEDLLGRYITSSPRRGDMYERIGRVSHGICDSGILNEKRLDTDAIRYYNKGQISDKYPVRNAFRYFEVASDYVYKFTIQDYLLHGDFILYNNGCDYINIIHYNTGKVMYKVVINVDVDKIYIETDQCIRYKIVDKVGTVVDILSLQGKIGIFNDSSIYQITLDGKNYNIDISTAKIKTSNDD